MDPELLALPESRPLTQHSTSSVEAGMWAYPLGATNQLAIRTDNLLTVGSQAHNKLMTVIGGFECRPRPINNDSYFIVSQ